MRALTDRERLSAYLKAYYGHVNHPADPSALSPFGPLNLVWVVNLSNFLLVLSSSTLTSVP